MRLRPWLLATLVLLGLLAALVQVNVLRFAFRRLGLSEAAALVVLLASVLGGLVNIPVARLHGDRPVRELWRTPFGWLLTVVPPRPTVLAVNLGGAVIPIALSGYVLVRTGIYWQAALGVVVVAVLVHRRARVLPDVGIVVPAFLPALCATAVTLVLHPMAAAALAYVSGTLGTLVGADLANLRAVVRSGPAAIAIGGAGSFDGIVLSGVVAVLIVTVL